MANRQKNRGGLVDGVIGSWSNPRTRMNVWRLENNRDVTKIFSSHLTRLPRRKSNDINNLF